MNITGGKNNSRIIKTPDFVNVKPTLSKVRQAVFNVLASFGDFKNFLDLFSGSGIMAFEAESREFEVTAVEKDKRTADFIKQNIKSLNSLIKIYNIEAIKFLNSTEEKFDVIYIDPPYENINLYKDSIQTIFQRKILSDNGVIVIEKLNSSIIDYSPFGILKEKDYSDKKIVFLTKT